MTTKTVEVVVSSFLELTAKLDSGAIQIPIELFPEDNPPNDASFERVYDRKYLECAFSRIRAWSGETGRVSVKQLNVVE